MSKPRIQSPVAPAGRIEQTLERLARALGRHKQPEERRAERRVPAHGTARMLWRRPEDGQFTTVVHLLDISPLGLAVRCTCRLPLQDQILLSDGRMLICGVVRHCTADAKEFTIGVEILPGENGSDFASLRLLGG